jgi:hypothetical protein
MIMAPKITFYYNVIFMQKKKTLWVIFGIKIWILLKKPFLKSLKSSKKFINY